MKAAWSLAAFAVLGMATARASGPTVSVSPPPLLPPALRDTMQQGTDCFVRGKYRQAAVLFEQARTSAPDNVLVLSNLAMAHFRLDQFNKAASLLQQAILLAPGDAWLHGLLSVVRFRQKRDGEALVECYKTIELNPKNACAHSILGMIYERRNDHERAEAEWKRGQELDPAAHEH